MLRVFTVFKNQRFLEKKRGIVSKHVNMVVI